MTTLLYPCENTEHAHIGVSSMASAYPDDIYHHPWMKQHSYSDTKSPSYEETQIEEGLLPNPRVTMLPPFCNV
jgi:hypothetical protein